MAITEMNVNKMKEFFNKKLKVNRPITDSKKKKKKKK
jgi:hypothetical protein